MSIKAKNLWQEQKNAVGKDGKKFGIQHSPSITAIAGGCFMAWNGSGKDGIWYAKYDQVNGTWSQQKNAIDTVGGKFGIQGSPSVAAIDNKVFMAWNGSGNDGIWYSIYDTISETWSPQINAGGKDGIKFGIQGSPAVTAMGTNESHSNIPGISAALSRDPKNTDKMIFMAWSGSGNDGIWYSIYDIVKGTWHMQKKAVSTNGTVFGIQASPSLAAIGNTVFMAWNGSGNDGIWYSTMKVNSSQLNVWEPQINIPVGILRHTNPSVTSVGDQILMMWHGASPRGILALVYNLA